MPEPSYKLAAKYFAGTYLSNVTTDLILRRFVSPFVYSPVERGLASPGK
jgi:hypothetical protein